ncbi:amidase [Bradyrhizobium sp. dw_78]|uniref:amidase n=1 Tax=Bradyrhizobium sp. dw_78 TaxID=2719793 RepID=UPI001BD1EFDD|nr:amidase [Bradyrhizobium sp. dw_78]
MRSDLAFAPATELLRLMESREVSSREILELQLERIARFNPTVNAIIYLDVDAARARADAADADRARGKIWGKLHGLPMTVKDVHNVAGWPTTYGDPANRDWRPERNAAVIDRLIGAGAIIFGKTNVPFNSADFQSFNAIHGTTHNPWAHGRTPGGSSGGAAAALAAGLSPVEFGSDIAGSIRFPSHFCGVYGHKPTHGIVTAEHNLRRGAWLDNDLLTSGPMARSVEDLALLMDVVAGPGGPAAKAWSLDLPAARATQLPDFRVALIEDSAVAPIDAPYRARIREFAGLLRGAGANIAADTFPAFDQREAHETFIRLLRGSAAASLPESVYDTAVQISEGLAKTDMSYKAQLRRAQAQRHRDYIFAEQNRMRIKQAWAEFFEKFDILLAPVTLSSAFPLDEQTVREERTLNVNGRLVDYNDQMFWAGYSTLPSLPVTSIPIGFDANGLPVGLQVIGPYLEDRTTLAFAAAASAIQSFVAPPGFS